MANYRKNLQMAAADPRNISLPMQSNNQDLPYKSIPYSNSHIYATPNLYLPIQYNNQSIPYQSIPYSNSHIYVTPNLYIGQLNQSPNPTYSHNWPQTLLPSLDPSVFQNNEQRHSYIKSDYWDQDDFRFSSLSIGNHPVHSVQKDNAVQSSQHSVQKDNSVQSSQRITDGRTCVHADKTYQKKYADPRADARGQFVLGERMRIFKRSIPCPNDIHLRDDPLLAIYRSLVPPKEEQEKKQQLLASLERIVMREWPHSKLCIYGSCANTFGFSKCDIDVSLEMEDPFVNKSDVVMKLAEMLRSHNFQNVKVYPRARVPVVKLLNSDTGISCDICINNSLAIVNTKLLKDYAQVDPRLQQLVFIVKHWAKSRKVNETYKGTLSSYAYVLMCINFLQMRKPSILPCLQKMNKTYKISIGSNVCAYFDQVQKLSGFGSSNRETIGQLVWEFFQYWAYYHDYANDVISVRTGGIISKREKNWTRRIGNDSHLICIEDPFELDHDLGRVVDFKTILVLREEFERAAEILRHEPNPCAKLFQPYIPPQ